MEMAHSTETLAVHAGREDFSALGVHAPPLDLSSTYPVPHLEEGIASLDAFVEGKASAVNPIYSRLYNPTVANFEKALADLEGATDAVAYASGMAATTAALMATRILYGEKPRNHVVAMRPLYGGTDHLLSSGLLGFEVTWTNAEGIADAIRADTALVMVETPANPTCKLMDIEAVVQAAGEIPVFVDSTFATPIFQNPLEWGATVVMHSATKFLGGHGDVLAGVLATKNEKWAAALRQVRIVTGANLHPLAAWLCIRSMPTLPMRVERATMTATDLSERLAKHPAVQAVHYPKADDPVLQKGQMKGRGALLAFEIAGGTEAAAKLMARVRLCVPAVSLGSTDTLIQHPAGLTHRVLSPEAKEEAGVTDGLIRLSVGLESADDLWADIRQALE